ncbi:MAG: hypothetical protein H7Y39_05045 [Nitrospiraceae bacterium]|nr:hypothetical protein [Nitrospiraceae bacterium]
MKTDGMARQSKQEYLRTMHPRYRQAKRAEKTRRWMSSPRCVATTVSMRSGCSTGRCPSRPALGGSRGGLPDTARR